MTAAESIILPGHMPNIFRTVNFSSCFVVFLMEWVPLMILERKVSDDSDKVLDNSE